MAGPILTAQQEEWRDVFGFPGYEVSNLGRVRSFRTPRGLTNVPTILKPTIGTTKRYKLALRRNAKRCDIDLHRIILEAFVGPPPEPGMWALHRDDNPLNNAISNLYWGNPKRNGEDRKRNGHNPDKRGEKHHLAKLTAQQVLSIRERAASGETHDSIAPDFGVRRETISQIARRERWSHI